MISRKVIAAIHARKQKTIAVSTFAIYCFCLPNIAIFGHFGDRSVFGATTPRKHGLSFLILSGFDLCGAALQAIIGLRLCRQRPKHGSALIGALATGCKAPGF
jgi:hypothetical protein